jgi:hypothetical protein
MEDPVTERASDIINCVIALRSALQTASAADRAMAVILATDDLMAIYDRVACDHSYFSRAFAPGRPPQPLPRAG